MLRALPVFLLLSCLCATALHAETRVFEIRHGDVQQLLPVVQPLLGPYDSASVYRNTLVVSAQQDVLQRVAELLARLDTPLRNLLISVRRAGNADRRSASGSVAGSARRGDITVSAGTRARDGVQITTTRERSTRDRNAAQSVRALEGRPVLISDGRLVPLASSGWRGPGVAYHEIQQGFQITARVVDQRVLLEIDSSGERLEDGTISSSALQSRVTGALGEWIFLGGSSTSATGSGTGFPGSAHTRLRDDSEQIEVRVELLD